MEQVNRRLSSIIDGDVIWATLVNLRPARSRIPNHPLSHPPPGPGDLRWCGRAQPTQQPPERRSTSVRLQLAQETGSTIEGLSAITLATHDMPRAVRFYQALGFEVLHGSEGSTFTSFRAGDGYLNLIVQPQDRAWTWWDG